MDFSSFWEEFFPYLQSEDFRKGIYVEIGGMGVDLLLISIFVPTFIWLINLRKNRQAKIMATFYTLQFHRATIDILLKLGGVVDTSKELDKLLANKQIESIFSHFFYGNTENLLQLLKIRINNSSHISGHKSLTKNKVIALAQNVGKLLDDLDRYIFLFNSIGLSEYSKKFFEARTLLYPLRDYLSCEPKQGTKMSDINDEFSYLTNASVDFFEDWFVSEKKYPDKRYRFKYRIQMAMLFVSLPYVLISRLIMPKICWLRKKPYLDKSGSNFFTLISVALQVSPLFDIDDVEKNTGIKKDLLMRYFQGYKRPNEAIENKVLSYFMQIIQPEQWNKLVIATLKQDVFNQKPSLVTVEAVKANAVYRFCTYIRNTGRNDDEIFKTFMRLFQLRPF